MIRFPHVLALALVSATLVSGCKDDDAPGIESGPVTVRVMSSFPQSGAQPVPYVNALVSVNDVTGKTIVTGTTAADGRFTANNVTSGASITVATPSGGQLSKLLHTVYDVQPGGEYLVSHPTKDPTPVGTVTISISGVPAGGSILRAYIGKCGNQAAAAATTLSIAITSDCLQSDGKASLYAYVENSTQQLHAYAVVTDVTLPASGNFTVNANAWQAVAGANDLFTVRASFLNSAHKLDYFSPVLSYSRRGVSYGATQASPGQLDMETSTSFTDTIFQVIPTLVERSPGYGYFLAFGGTFTGRTGGTRQSGARISTDTLPRTGYYDLSAYRIAQEIVSLEADLNDSARPELYWTTETVAAGEVDAAVAVLSWGVGGALVNWITVAPADLGMASFPELDPVLFAGYLPAEADDGLIDGPLLLLVDASWRAGYQDFVRNDHAGPVFWQSHAVSENSTLLLHASNPTNVVYKSSGAAAAQIDLLGNKPLLGL